MRLQIDTKAKIIKLEEKVLLKELVVTLERLLPKKEWQTFTLEANTVINNWSSPIYIREYRPWAYHWYSGSVLNQADNKSYAVNTLAEGTYNVEV